MSDAQVADLTRQALLRLDRQAIEAKQPIDKQLARILADLQAIVKELDRVPPVGLDPEWKTKDILSRVRSVVGRIPSSASAAGTAAATTPVLGGDKGLPPDAKGKPVAGKGGNTVDLFDPNA